MSKLKKYMVFLGVALLLFSGCKAVQSKQENPSRKVSDELRTSIPGLPEEEWKESNVSYEDMLVEFQDPAVEAVLRDIIGKLEGEVYISELQKIHMISFNGDELQNIAPLQNLNDLSYCYNLQWLGFANINVPSLEPLAVLPQLEELLFSAGANVTEQILVEIGELPALKSIRIGPGEHTDWRELTDGSFLLPLADRLTELYAKGNIEWNPEVLAQMTKLEILKLENEDDLSFLKHLTELKKLYLYCCTPEDWSPLGSLESLEYLSFTGNMYTMINIDLEELQPLTKLDYLELIFTSIDKEYSREEIIDALPSLTGLYIW